MGSKSKMYIHVDQASHFLRWEMPLFGAAFDLVSEPRSDSVLFAFGPDVLDSGARMPAAKRVAMLFPGFGRNPYHDLAYRSSALYLLEEQYDLFFVNPGPLEAAYSSSPKMRVCNFTVDSSLVGLRSYRERLDSLLHVSSDFPQKDWPRSEQVMRSTGLPFEVFPPRGGKLRGRREALLERVNSCARKLCVPLRFDVPPYGYVDHGAVVRKYQQYDGFVHVAAEINNNHYIDGKYTACLIEAGITGSILFWHDTLGLGHDLETVFELPVDPQAAARQLLEIRRGIDVPRHSRLTREEMLDRFSPAASVAQRISMINEL